MNIKLQKNGARGKKFALVLVDTLKKRSVGSPKPIKKQEEHTLTAPLSNNSIKFLGARDRKPEGELKAKMQKVRQVCTKIKARVDLPSTLRKSVVSPAKPSQRKNIWKKSNIGRII